MAFRHTERPHGAPDPYHSPATLDALSGIANRTGQETTDKVKPPSPVAIEALRRIGSQGGQQQQPMQQPMQPFAVPMQQPPPMQQPMPPMAQPEMPQAPVQEEEMPDGYWNQELAKTIEGNPELEKQWRPVLDRFNQIREALDRITPQPMGGK